VSAICCTSCSTDLAGDELIETFACLWQKFQNIFEIKLKEINFFGAKFKQPFEEHNSNTKLNAIETRDWEHLTTSSEIS